MKQISPKPARVILTGEAMSLCSGLDSAYLFCPCGSAAKFKCAVMSIENEDPKNVAYIECTECKLIGAAVDLASVPASTAHPNRDIWHQFFLELVGRYQNWSRRVTDLWKAPVSPAPGEPVMIYPVPGTRVEVDMDAAPAVIALALNEEGPGIWKVALRSGGKIKRRQVLVHRIMSVKVHKRQDGSHVSPISMMILYGRQTAEIAFLWAAHLGDHDQNGMPKFEDNAD